MADTTEKNLDLDIVRGHRAAINGNLVKLTIGGCNAVRLDIRYFHLNSPE
jgi:hypothetical protein